MENLILKSGFTNVESVESNEEIKLQMSALITVFMENAIKTAEIYTKSANRNVITPQDISLSLKRELFTFLDNDDIEVRAAEILEEFKSNLENNEEDDEEYEDEDEEEDEDEDEDEYEDEEDDYKKDSKLEEKNNIEEIFTVSKSDCKISTEVNMYAEKWKTWKPTNNIEKILWNGINKIDNDFNLF